MEDALIAAGMNSQIKKLNFVGFSDIPINKRSVARCSGITATVVATEEP